MQIPSRVRPAARNRPPARLAVYGERWASNGLDLARYADTEGLGHDQPRTAWPYRDWVVRAFNADMPFDQFTIKQLSGDLLPAPTLDDLIATNFHRQSQNNGEGGADDEEFRVAAVMDRVATTWEAWQGVTMGCVQCHSHPYEPILHNEYYTSYAFFNNVRDYDLSQHFPLIPVAKDPALAKYFTAWWNEQKSLLEKITTTGTPCAPPPHGKRPQPCRPSPNKSPSKSRRAMATRNFAPPAPPLRAPSSISASPRPPT